MKTLDHWQVEAFADLHGLTFPPPEWSAGAIERAALPALWVHVITIDQVVAGRPSVCLLPLPWAQKWCINRGADVLHLPHFESAFVGVGVFPRSQPCLVYDKSFLVDQMIEETEDNALGVSLFESKLSKAYYGAGSPGFLTLFSY